MVLDVDATLVTSHSEKEHAAPTFKGGFGYHPLAVWCDNTQEMLAVVMRPGNAGSNTVADHIGVLTQAIAQVPSSYRKHMLIRADGAGSSHGLLDWLTEQGTKRGRTVEYSVGFATNGKVRDAIAKLPKKVWTAAVNADGDVREGGDVAEITTLLDLSGWPAGMRLIVRRERPHPGAELSLFEEADGYRYQVVATNTGVGQLAFLEARHRAHAWVEDRIRNAKDSGLGLPLPGLRDQHRLGPARSDQRRPHRLAAAARADTRASQGQTQSTALPTPACPRQTDHRRATPAAADPIDLAMGHSNRDRVRQNRRDTGTRLSDLHQPAQPTKDPRRTATRKRQPGLRHTH